MGVFIGLLIQFAILNLRIVLMQRQLKHSGEIQITFFFIYVFYKYCNPSGSFYQLSIILAWFWFFIAHNLNILNIAFITNRSVKKND